jgi:hypothetical protein
MNDLYSILDEAMKKAPAAKKAKTTKVKTATKTKTKATPFNPLPTTPSLSAAPAASPTTSSLSSVPPVSASTTKSLFDFNKLIERRDLDKFTHISTTKTKFYNKEKEDYIKRYNYWKKMGSTPNSEPQPPVDARSADEKIFGSFLDVLESHIGKSSYIEAIDHMLKFTDDNYKNWFQRLKSNL